MVEYVSEEIDEVAHMQIQFHVRRLSLRTWLFAAVAVGSVLLALTKVTH